MFKRLYYILLQRVFVLLNRNRVAQGRIYMFHNVDDDTDIYSINKEDFELFLYYLCDNKKIVDVDTLIKEKDPDNVLITFDDVYESVYRNAYPLLKEKDVPYYLFVCNEYLNKDGYLNKEMLKEMLSDSKAILGSHNSKHELSRFKDHSLLEKELSSSKKELESISGTKIGSMAFPFGSMYACSKENIATAEEIYEYIFMTYPISYNEKYGNVIPRINMNSTSFRKEMK